MSTNYTSYAQHSNATITVTTTAELDAALNSLSNGGGGTILLDGNGGPFDIFGNGLGDANNPILIKAVDSTNPPLVQNIYLVNSSHIAMTELHVDSTGTGNTVHDLRVSSSDHIEFVGNTMTSNADGFLDGTGSATKGASASLIRDSSDIVFSNNTMTNYGAGTGFLEVNGLDYSNNDISGFQYDGFAGGGLQNVTITNNNMYDFWGSTQTINHSDYIMIWGTNAQTVTTNVNISNNIIDTGNLAAYQGIFIGNSQLGNTGPSGQYFQNIQVYDNIVHTSMWHGITVGETQNLEIYNNAVLFNDQSFYKVDPASAWTQAQPWIMANNAPNAVVYGNISGKVIVNGANDYSTNNQLLDYNDPAIAQYIDDFMANLPTWSGGSGVTGGSGSGGSTGSGGTSGGTDTSGADSSGGDTSGGNTSGGDTSGGDTSGGDTSSGGTSGGSGTSGEAESGGNNSGDEATEDANAIHQTVQKFLSPVMDQLSTSANAAAQANAAGDTQNVTLDDVMALFQDIDVPQTPTENEDDEMALALEVG